MATEKKNEVIPDGHEYASARACAAYSRQFGPRSLRIDPVKISQVKQYFEEEPPLNAYEEIKRRNMDLHKLSAEQEAELLQSKLVDEKKTEFISIASHEIKTPITILKAYTQMARAVKEPMTDHLKGLLAKIDTQSAKLVMLVQQLLDISRMENGNLQYAMQEISINDFINDQLAIMKHILPEHNVTAILHEDVKVNVDKLRMEQVFSNLLGNAAKYSLKNTAISISTLFDEDGFITLAITDKGKGISAESIKSIFNKFYRATDVVKTHSGLGMGLYVSSKIISDHGGRIWAESAEGSGSTFFFTIPVVA